MEMQDQEETEARILDGSLVRTLRSVKMLAEGDEHMQSIKVFIKYGKITRKSVEGGIAILQKSDRRRAFGMILKE